jgi:glycosyltransferase involved in cell wall biosynthesis
MLISAVVVAKDEEKYIAKCLKSLNFCDEIILVDTGSKDETVNIAKKYTGQIYKKEFKEDFSEIKNYGLSKAKGDWVLFVDADEEVSQPLQKNIMEALKVKNDKSGYFIKREDVLFGREMKFGESGRYFLRLAGREEAKWVRAVHETLTVSGSTSKLEGNLSHNSHETVTDFINTINKYSNIHASENLKEGKRSTVIKIIFFPVLKFFEDYGMRLGFLDGNYGLVSAILMSFHSFLAWSKLYMLQKNK